MKCPICQKPSVEQYKPFCCRRCADVDLSRWFRGTYAVAAVEHEDEEPEVANDNMNEQE